MSIKGFNVNGVTEQYDYNSLDNIPDIQGLPTGGTEGQVLAKTSGADYAVGWVDQTGGGGGSETDEIFWATRNVTTFAEVQEAVADGKLCAVKTGGSLSSDTYYLFYISDTRATFGNFSIINSRISALSLYSSNSWTYESLTIPEVLTFDTTPKQYSNNPVRSYGIWNAIQAAKTTVDATLSATSENPVQNRSVYEALATKADLSSVEPFVQDAVDEWMETYAPTIGTLSNAAKRALLNCFAHVAWIDNQGQTYYDALENELFPDSTLQSITAVFTQGSAVIYDTDSLDILRQYLVVTATYSDSTTETVTNYTLSGTLTEGTSTITVSYGGKTDTFTVTVTVVIFLFKDGDECTSITGGWNPGVGFVTNASRGTASKTNEELVFTLTTTASTGHDVALSISTQNAIDFTSYSKLVVEFIGYKVNSTGTTAFWAYYPSTLNTAATQVGAYGSDYSSHRNWFGISDVGITEKRTVEADIASQTGARYLSMNFNPYGNAAAGAYVRISRIYLVPTEE